MAENEYQKIVQRTRNAFEGGITKNVDFRIQQLKNLYNLCSENEQQISTALSQDLGKPLAEGLIYEIEFVLNEIRCMLYNIRKWVKPEDAEKSLNTLILKTFVKSEPYGVVLVLGTWNFPLPLCLCPMAGAIAAGNCVILKPSELSPKTAELFTTLIPKYLDHECFQVINGGPAETTELLKEEFDYIFYTGSTQVGRIIGEAANKHLTPTTLELGGKSPVFFDDNVDFDVACKRLLWGKFSNAGQTCVAPDYILCTKEIQEKIVVKFKKYLKEFYGVNPKASPDYGRIVNERHFHRLLGYLKDMNIAIGGDYDESNKYIAPTVLTDVKLTDTVMREEIFGPIFPIVTVDGVDDAIYKINSMDKPLSLFIFSKNSKVIQKIIDNTSSGSVNVNNSALNISIDELPFGGVGKSGMGAYHGKYSFDTFSHKKAVVIQDYGMIGEKLFEYVYPPYSKSKTQFLRSMIKKRRSILPPHMDYVGMFLVGFGFAFLLKLILHYAGVQYF